MTRELMPAVRQTKMSIADFLYVRPKGSEVAHNIVTNGGYVSRPVHHMTLFSLVDELGYSKLLEDSLLASFYRLEYSGLQQSDLLETWTTLGILYVGAESAEKELTLP